MLQKEKVINTPFYYGWLVVFVSALSVFFSGPGQTFAISIFIEYYIADFDYSRTLVSGLYSAATLCAGFLLFTIGKLTDLYGQRLMMVIIGLSLAFAALWNAFIVGPVMMFLGFFMLRLFGQGSMTLLPNTLVPQWFMRKRGRALSVMAIGGFAGAALIPPLNTYMIQMFDWRTVWLIWSGALAFIFVPLAILIVRNKPEDIGEVIDGQRKPVRSKGPSRIPLFVTASLSALVLVTMIPTIDQYLHELFTWFPPMFWRILIFTASFIGVMVLIRNRYIHQPSHTKERVGEEEQKEEYDDEVSWTLKEAARTRAFWMILFCVSVPALTNTGITFHLVSISEGKGLTPEVAAIVLSLMAIIGFPVTFISGYLVDKIKVHYVLSITFVIHIVAIIWLWQTQSATAFIIYGVIWGIAHGFERITLNIVWPNYFGRQHLGSIKSIAQSVMVVGSALGPLPFGFFYDWLGGYSEILLLSLLLPLIAAIFAFISPAPNYNEQKKR
ncbi:MFS transporter [Alkalibacillus haloalkaliphilus]|uniref:MFS transporter n=1 Tax=Alkalibacillus haloalkaliphilus TaxID=94136 RepID=UPI002935BB5B|nr:MFS transporter [Alkalibacillus haloalkaliphilus]MDV2583392.1 MFS transporter [Alkalibacillus haloalkaliphilus]